MLIHPGKVKTIVKISVDFEITGNLCALWTEDTQIKCLSYICLSQCEKHEWECLDLSMILKYSTDTFVEFMIIIPPRFSFSH